MNIPPPNLKCFQFVVVFFTYTQMKTQNTCVRFFYILTSMNRMLMSPHKYVLF